MNNIFEYEEFILNEKFNFKSIIKKIKDKPRKDLINYLIIGLLSIYSISTTINIINNQNIDKTVKNEIKNELIKEIRDKEFKKGYKYILSDEGWDFIRNKEKLELKVYKLGDNKITIGY